MKTIAFIDDEQSILDGLRRMLRHRRPDWDMHFYTSGSAILGELNAHHFDMVISDMRMPSMSGAEVLGKIKDSSPDTVRVALSGYAEEEMILESVHATHQFIAKPAEQEKICQCIERAMLMQDSLCSDEIKSRLGSVESLPALPHIYDELMQEMSSDQASIDSVGSIVERDIALSTSLLKIVNSAFFGLVRHVESPKHAASILGMEAIKNLALSTCVFSSFEKLGSNADAMINLNVFSQRVGVLAGKMAKQTPLSKRAQDHAQIAGMMVNLGELIKMTLLTEPPLKEVLEDKAKANGQAQAIKPELDDGPLIGSYLLGIWALPFPVIEALRWHRDPSASQMQELSPLTIVHAAWSMLSAFNRDQEINLENELIQTDYLQAALGESGLLDWVEMAGEFCTVDE